MPEAPREARTERCSSPSGTTAKQLFGTATQCARPDCNKSLYRLEGDRPALNCEIAHIRASAPDGPRADPMMTCSEVNAFENLLLLCDYDHRLIDVEWERFPEEMLDGWKAQQVRQALHFGAVREPTDDEITELLVRSAAHQTVTHSASVDLARSVRRLRSAAERTRLEPEQILREREQAIAYLNRGTLVFDPETGERVEAQLSRADEREFDSRITDALRRIHGPVEAAADTVLADAAGVAASVGPATVDARAWVERSVAEVVSHSGMWPGALDEALDQMDAASAALAAAADGRPTFVPPPPPPPEPREPTRMEVFRDRVLDVNERAAPHSRVDHLRFDAAVHREVLELASDCAWIPTAPSMSPYALGMNAELAASTLKNADDEQFAHAVDSAERLQPEAAAAHHLRHLYFATEGAEAEQRRALVDAAGGRVSIRIIDRVSAPEFWEDNREHGLMVLTFAERVTGSDEVTIALRSAASDESLIDLILIALSETFEEMDSSTHEFLGIDRRFSAPDRPWSGLPSCVPVDAICAAIERRWPDGPRPQHTEAERLAAEFSEHRCSGS